jgi:hypothetical protein
MTWEEIVINVLFFVVKPILVRHSLAEFLDGVGSHHASCLENFGFQFYHGFVVFLQVSRQVLVWNLILGHGHFIPLPFQFTTGSPSDAL